MVSHEYNTEYNSYDSIFILRWVLKSECYIIFEYSCYTFQWVDNIDFILGRDLLRRRDIKLSTKQAHVCEEYSRYSLRVANNYTLLTDWSEEVYTVQTPSGQYIHKGTKVRCGRKNILFSSYLFRHYHGRKTNIWGKIQVCKL